MFTETPGGRKYIMTLIDDYSQYTYTFLLRQKSQATEVIKDFVEFCSTQFGQKPKLLGQTEAEYILITT